jgi:hypothetical protein
MNSKKTLLLQVLGLVGTLTCAAQFAFRPTADVTLRIVDETGAPIQNAKGYLGSFVGPPNNGKQEYIEASGLSDTNGIIHLRIRSDGDVSCGAKKIGYYDSVSLNQDAENLKIHFASAKFGHWVPRDMTNVLTLRPIGKPVPMYANCLNSYLPAVETFIGYDLERHDWVPPYGNGLRADLLLRGERDLTKMGFTAKLEITFPNPMDGIQEITGDRYSGSDFLFPRFAPTNGYSNSWSRTYSVNREGKRVGLPDPKRAFFFRVRSVVIDGHLMEAKYGKIRGDFQFSPMGQDNKTLFVTFCYYLNPDGTQNMEFDPKRNLFGNIRGSPITLMP